MRGDVPQVDGLPGQVTGKDIQKATEKAMEISNEKKAFYVDQFNNVSSIFAHEEGTGPEIWGVLGEELDAFVAAVGSGGTFIGTSRFLKARKPKMFCVPAEPEGAEILSGKEVEKPKHIIQGIGYGVVPPHWDTVLADATIAVSDEDATRFRKALAEREGLYVGFSAAANVCASIKLIRSGRLGSSPVVATILCDTGLKY